MTSDKKASFSFLTNDSNRSTQKLHGIFTKDEANKQTKNILHLLRRTTPLPLIQ